VPLLYTFLRISSWFGSSGPELPFFFTLFRFKQLDFPVLFILIKRLKYAGNVCSFIRLETANFLLFINNEVDINKIIVSCLFCVVMRAAPLPRAGNMNSKNK